MNDFMHGDLQDQGAVCGSYDGVAFGSQRRPHNLFGSPDLEVEQMTFLCRTGFRAKALCVGTASGPA